MIKLISKIFIIFIVSLPILAEAANDKRQIELTCGETKATITCTKFGHVEKDENVCLKSTLNFRLKNGKHIKSRVKAPQYFVIPTIADEIQCVKDNGKIYFIVSYSPDCHGGRCEEIYSYTLEGKLIPPGNDTFEGEPVFDPVVSLRGVQK